jgi:crotonobetainyl-CoA:carnitine CoA-transferase CaiB-like acyl-CoA transferase
MSQEFSKPNGPLSGLLVIDLTHVMNGPFGTMLLSDLGARVIKVEPPGVGDETRSFGMTADKTLACCSTLKLTLKSEEVDCHCHCST